MRSELVFVALIHEPNRYLLSSLIARATRKLHKPNTRVPDTMNDALTMFRGSAEKQQAVSSPPESIQLRRAA